MVAAGNMGAKIAVYKVAGNWFCTILARIFHCTSGFVQLMNEQSARPGTIYHIKVVIFVKKYSGVNGIWRIVLVPSSICRKPLTAYIGDCSSLNQFFKI